MRGRYNAVGCGGIGVEDTVAPGYTSRSPSHLTCSFSGGGGGGDRDRYGEKR